MLILHLIFLVCLVSQEPPNRPLTVKEVIERWDIGSKLIESYDLTVELKDEGFVTTADGIDRLSPTTEPVATQRSYSRIYKKGDKRFGEFSQDPGRAKSTALLFDGTTFTAAQVSRDEYSVDKHFTVFGSLVLLSRYVRNWFLSRGMTLRERW